jgi:hypothetical protein
MSLDYYHLLDANIKKEIVDWKIQPNRNVYAARKLVDKYKVKLFIKKIEWGRSWRPYPANEMMAISLLHLKGTCDLRN